MTNASHNIRYYFFNCFWLMVPVMLWNIFLTDKLPAAYQETVFWKDIPGFLTYGEQVSRILLFAWTLMLPLSVQTRRQKTGLAVYIMGVLLYFASWLALIYFPQSGWSQGWLGFFAPAYTPALWLGGIAITANRFYFRLPYRSWKFLALSLIFLVFHNAHTWVVYSRTT